MSAAVITCRVELFGVARLAAGVKQVTLDLERPTTLRALRHRNLRLFAGGQLISLIGTWMQTVAESWLVYRLTGSSALLGVSAFASQIPVFLFATIGGTVADRTNRHRIILKPEAEIQGVTPDDAVARILAEVPVPR